MDFVNNILANFLSKRLRLKGVIGMIFHLAILQYICSKLLILIGSWVHKIYGYIPLPEDQAAFIEPRIKQNIFDPEVWTNPYFLSYVIPFIVLYLIFVILPFYLTYKASPIYRD